MRVFYIGKFKVEPEKNKVSLPKAEFRLEPRVMSILCYLVQHQGQVLSKEKILASLWPNQALEPELVTKAVFEIRKILNDNPKQPRVIETIPRKGYVFIGKIEKETRKIHAFYLVCLSMFTVILIALFLHNTKSQHELDLSSVTTKKTIRHNTNGEINTISVNNSKQLLFAYQREVFSELYSHNDKTLKNTLIDTQFTEIKDIFSTEKSDYIVNCDDKCEVIKHKNNSFIPVLTINERIIKLSVSPDEKWLALQITKQNRHNIGLISLVEKDAKLFYLPLDGNEAHPVFSNNNNLYFISLSADRKNLLTNYNLETQQIKTNPIPIDRVGSLSLYADSQFVVTGRYNGQYALWLLALDPLSLSVLANIDPQQKVKDITVDKTNKTINYIAQNRPIKIQSKGALSIKIEHPSLNLDGVYLAKKNALIFSSNRSGSYEIWMEDQGQQSKLTDLNASYIHTIKVDNSESKVAFSYTKGKTKRVLIYSLLNNKIIGDIRLKNDSYLLNFDHTSTNLFISQRATQNYDLVSLNIKSQTHSKIAHNAGITAISDANGVYYYSFNNQNLQYQANSGNTNALFDFKDKSLQVRASAIKLTQDGFFYLSKVDKQQVVSFYNFNTKTIKPLFMLEQNQFVTDFGFINAGPFIIYDQDTDVTSQIISLEHIKLNSALEAN
ncbi:winged helix-turn-helix domain-containing protein [Pseudoalteromonas sp. G4]|uniref:winged helix-turn-helix domain-containing protein n=1 Tax=Pseudoalteromonas sp. G4 TaxID=2992761 RepID=UPI00237DF887|nr:winged helix-turn-helix domain-containing protein [Pseudoalteromonas sp. G4]MDE3272074.1 winged helix-turn-helix domain-containing protein [Pseudoalteromonas sp. G4]